MYAFTQLPGKNSTPFGSPEASHTSRVCPCQDIPMAAWKPEHHQHACRRYLPNSPCDTQTPGSSVSSSPAAAVLCRVRLTRHPHAASSHATACTTRTLAGSACGHPAKQPQRGQRNNRDSVSLPYPSLPYPSRPAHDLRRGFNATTVHTNIKIFCASEQCSGRWLHTGAVRPPASRLAPHDTPSRHSLTSLTGKPVYAAQTASDTASPKCRTAAHS